ncbi:hypothetical protein TrRE_jg3914, partial [Triparma retinervis]
ESNPTCERGIVLVDAFSPSHLLYLKRRALTTYNAGVVECFSPKVSRYLLGQSESSEERSDILARTMPSSRDSCASWAASLPFEVVGVLCESDSGGSVAERLTEWLGLDGERGNARMSARRDKYLMHKAIKDAGVGGTARGYVCEDPGEAVAKAAEMGVMDQDDERGVVYDERTPCVVKPRRGVASDRVFKCTTLQEVAEATGEIIGSTSFGNDEVIKDCLVQEFVEGLEVAVDTVTRNGETKIVAVWDYDKRQANGAPFVNFATRLVDGAFQPASEDEDLPPLNSTLSGTGGSGVKIKSNRTSPSSLSSLPRQARYVVVQKVCDYATSVLQSLEYNWGMAHVEVKVSLPRNFRKAYKKGSFEPPSVRLIEVNARQHNAEWLQLTQAPGRIVHLSCNREGTLRRVSHLERIRRMESVVKVEVYEDVEEGKGIAKTVDIRSEKGWVHMLHDDEEVLERDFVKVMELMETMFEVEEGGEEGREEGLGEKALNQP